MENGYVDQIGGDHYQSAYQHWTLVARTGLDYFTGQATKYLTRWRQKGGVEDLRKAVSYVQKLRHNAPLAAARSIVLPAFTKEWIYAELNSFFYCNKHITHKERRIFERLVAWETVNDLDAALASINELIAYALVERPVPVEDSNRHAERAERKSNEDRDQGTESQAGTTQAGASQSGLNR